MTAHCNNNNKDAHKKRAQFINEMHVNFGAFARSQAPANNIIIPPVGSFGVISVASRRGVDMKLRGIKTV